MESAHLQLNPSFHLHTQRNLSGLVSVDKQLISLYYTISFCPVMLSFLLAWTLLETRNGQPAKSIHCKLNIIQKRKVSIESIYASLTGNKKYH